MVDSFINEASEQYGELVRLSARLCSTPKFDSGLADYGISAAAFVFVESLLWFAQSIRSGAWTYYEATSGSRQQQMIRALEEFAPEGFSRWYSQGASDWRDEQRMLAVDAWIQAHDEFATSWLAAHAEGHRFFNETAV